MLYPVKAASAAGSCGEQMAQDQYTYHMHANEKAISIKILHLENTWILRIYLSNKTNLHFDTLGVRKEHFCERIKSAFFFFLQ